MATLSPLTARFARQGNRSKNRFLSAWRRVASGRLAPVAEGEQARFRAATVRERWEQANRMPHGQTLRLAGAILRVCPCHPAIGFDAIALVSQGAETFGP